MILRPEKLLFFVELAQLYSRGGDFATGLLKTRRHDRTVCMYNSAAAHLSFAADFYVALCKVE
jgi:hypothetical protein